MVTDKHRTQRLACNSTNGALYFKALTGLRCFNKNYSKSIEPLLEHHKIKTCFALIMRWAQQGVIWTRKSLDHWKLTFVQINIVLR